MRLSAPAVTVASAATGTDFAAYRRLWYCDNMKNITVSVDDDVYRIARVKAAERDTSVSALVKGFLASLAADSGDFEHLAREELALRERVRHFRAGDRLTREDLHRRR